MTNRLAELNADMSETDDREAYELAGRLQDTLLSLESRIPEVIIDGRLVRLTLNQIRTLHLLKNRPGVHQKDVAQVLGITQPSMSALVGKLRRLGLAESRPDADDRRANGLFITAEGQAAYDSIRQSQVSMVAGLLSVLPIETQRAVVQALETALKQLESASS